MALDARLLAPYEGQPAATRILVNLSPAAMSPLLLLQCSVTQTQILMVNTAIQQTFWKLLVLPLGARIPHDRVGGTPVL